MLESPGNRVSGNSRRSNSASGQELSQEERRRVQQLQQRDREVRAHERAHLMAGRELVVRGASYSYQRGPDDKQYAVGGEVTIDTSPVRGDPQATREKARRIRETALAPAQPSNQDRSVAARATQMAMQARIEILRQREDESTSATVTPSADMARAYRQTQSPHSGARSNFHHTA